MGFLANIPTWAWVLIAIVTLYGLYRYWQYRKATAYAPKITQLPDLSFVSKRDNPANGG